MGDRFDAVILLDYNLGLMNPIMISKLTTQLKKINKNTIIRPTGEKYLHYENGFLVLMNRKVASSATGMNLINETSNRIMGTKILREMNCKGLFIPWIENTSYFFTAKDVTTFPSLMKFPLNNVANISSISVSMLALMAAINAPLDSCAKIAHVAASLSAMKGRDELISLDELKEVIEHGSIVL
jgi:bifunctional ADP-heptose synthase (sugar kinase/adenylyltransferase)